LRFSCVFTLPTPRNFFYFFFSIREIFFIKKGPEGPFFFSAVKL